MEVYLMKRSTMGGSNLMKEAFIHKETCELKCGDLKEEWVDYRPLKASGEEISGGRVIVEGKVYNLDKTDPKVIYRKRALKKLTKKEKEALGL